MSFAGSSSMFVRARLIAEVVDAALAVNPQLFAALTERALASVAGAAPTAWLSADAYVAMHDEILALGGDDMLRDVSRRSVAITRAGPLLTAVTALAQRFLSRRPASVLRWLPAARAMILRGFGEVTFREVENGAVVEIRGCPLSASRSFRIAHEGVLLGILDDVSCDGQVTSHADETGISLALSWWPKRPRAASNADTRA